MSRLSLKTLLFTVIGFWSAFAVAAFSLSCVREQLGQFGDAFGVLNTLFSGLAFVVIYRTLVEEVDRKTSDALNAQRQTELNALATLAQITQALWENNRDMALKDSLQKDTWSKSAKTRYDELIVIRNRLSDLIDLPGSPTDLHTE